jgi:hypothetical protein
MNSAGASAGSYATWRRLVTWRNQRINGFQLALFWSTNFKSLISKDLKSETRCSLHVRGRTRKPVCSPRFSPATQFADDACVNESGMTLAWLSVEDDRR